jgi:hypothetical protein
LQTIDLLRWDRRLRLSSLEQVQIIDLEFISVVALTDDLPANGLLRGQVGTIVEKLAPGIYRG